MRETENMLDKAVLASRSSRSLMSANGGGGDGGKSAVAPLVIVDEREFRSTLPYQLYRRGLDIVPLTLTTADYVLSPSFGVERKSVQDFCMSIQSGRISHQLALLSSRFEFPICLIEFESNHPFRLSFKSAWGSSLKASHMSHMYSQIGSIVTAFPKVRFVWSQSPFQTAYFFSMFKKSVAVENEDPCNSILTSRGMDTNSEVQTAESERSHYAKEILMRFPGVKDSNVESVMAASGSLAGLAQLTKEALVAAMGEHDGQLLHSFLSASLKES
ncbi:hypothetical protein AGDE_12546 [Angomonas deanei]|uniref:ERCC4 domain containing protein, putative n=1 Tax=Angomonas deanei TaxID=59799 RepID=A0A7G2CDC2_9TRYP|nr:hypothetical protein AGDE_12546 [Angomonas deanei]CAD2217021.1 ERCC4 domain containing protein, putative [Angomonas deanei]|eukprot:EPY24169.1 hypothetical protein AGDE_12546 [Angomonas deanei]